MNPLGGFGRDITEIAGLLIGVTIIGLLVTNASGTSKVIGAATAGFGNLLSIASFQRNNFGAPFAL